MQTDRGLLPFIGEHLRLELDPIALEPWLRASVFAVVVATLVVAERRWPHRRQRERTGLAVNVALLLTNTLAIRLIAASSLVGLSATLTTWHWGLLSQVDFPQWIETGLAVVLLDASMYAQHRLFHAVPALWRLHRVHHSDIAFDVTTGFRFHPGEILVSFGFKAATIALVGASMWAVLVFELLLSSASLFEHANLGITSGIDRRLRTTIVTPVMHRVHHSVHRDEHNSNFGFLLVWWDRLFASYRSASREDDGSMSIGLENFRTGDEQRFGALLMQPLEPR